MKLILKLSICLNLVVTGFSVINAEEVNVEEMPVEETMVEVSTRGVDPSTDVTADFKDPNFQKWVVDTYGDGTTVTAGALEGVTKVSPTNLGIEDLSGLEHFTSVNSLNISGNNFPTLNLADLPKTVTILQVSNSNITTLNTAGGDQIVQLTVNNNPMAELDLAPLTSLKTINALNLVNLSSIDFSGVPSLERISLNGSSLITSLDLSAQTNLDSLSAANLILTELILSPNVAGKDFILFIVAGTGLETIENLPATAYMWNISGQKVEKKLMLNSSGQYYIQMHKNSIITEENLAAFLPGEVEFNPITATLTWLNEKNPETIIEMYDQQILFDNESGGKTPIRGSYLLLAPDEVNEDVYHTVNFKDCEGKIIAQGWPQDGTTVTAPSGYVYESSALTNVTFSKDVTPVNCAGGFTIPNTGK